MTNCNQPPNSNSPPGECRTEQKHNRGDTAMTKRTGTAMVAAVVTMMMATTAFAGPCRDRHHGQRGHPAPWWCGDRGTRGVRVPPRSARSGSRRRSTTERHHQPGGRARTTPWSPRWRRSRPAPVERDAVLRGDLDREARDRSRGGRRGNGRPPPGGGRRRREHRGSRRRGGGAWRRRPCGGPSAWSASSRRLKEEK